MFLIRSHFPITPQQAVAKFLVDMRVAGERGFRPWRQRLEDGFAKTSLAPSDRRELLSPHPLDDYFYAGLVGLQVSPVRRHFSPTVAEALLRQVALQVDDAVGRSDRVVSNLVFVIFGRIRKNTDIGLTVPDADVVIDVILERLAIDRLRATRHLMTDGTFRRALSAPLLEREPWWNAFSSLYKVNVPTAKLRRGTRSGARERFLTRSTSASALLEALPSPSPPLSPFARALGAWLTPRPHVH